MTAPLTLTQHSRMATTKSSSKPKIKTPKPSTKNSNLSPFARELGEHVAAMTGLIKRQKLAQLTPEQVKYTVGRIPPAELPALKIVVDLMHERAELFAVMADRDRGKDAKKVETEPTREAMARFEELAPVLEALKLVMEKLEHEVLAQGTRIRAVTSPAYQLAKVMSQSDEDVANTLGPAFTYYGEPGRKGKAKRKGK